MRGHTARQQVGQNGVFAGLVLTSDGVSVFVGLHVEVGVTGASGAGGLETEQPIVVGQRCGHLRLLWSVVRRAQYKAGN